MRKHLDLKSLRTRTRTVDNSQKMRRSGQEIAREKYDAHRLSVVVPAANRRRLLNMQKMYLDLPFVSGITNAHTCTSEQIYHHSGANLGNFAFRHALNFIVHDLPAYEPLNYAKFHTRTLEGPIERVLLSAANWLGASGADEESNLNRVYALEKIDAPTVVFGLGVQAKAGAEKVELGPNTVRLAKLLGERSAIVSVRDDLTQRTLADLGIYNSVVTGCPSSFISGDPALGAKIMTRAMASAERKTVWGDVRALISEFSGGHAASGRILAKCLQMMRDTPAFYAVQSPALLPYLLREVVDLPSVYISNSPFNGDEAMLERVLKAKAMHFSNMDGWLDFSRTCELSYGMRIHGTVVPLQAGVPSVLISHDSRTAGLSKVMGVPSMPPDVFLQHAAKGPSAIFEAIAKAMDGFDAHRNKLSHIMVDFLVRNELEPHSQLKSLTTPTETSAA